MLAGLCVRVRGRGVGLGRVLGVGVGRAGVRVVAALPVRVGGRRGVVLLRVRRVRVLTALRVRVVRVRVGVLLVGRGLLVGRRRRGPGGRQVRGIAGALTAVTVVRRVHRHPTRVMAGLKTA
ncbi:hypothetical protein GCM10010400_44770 [Streptomyces aculeolatus]